MPVKVIISLCYFLSVLHELPVVQGAHLSAAPSQTHGSREKRDVEDEVVQIFDARSSLSRQVYGYPKSSIRVENLKTFEQQIKIGFYDDRKKVVLIDDSVNEDSLCRTNKVVCYSGKLSEMSHEDDIEDDIQFPKDVSFSALNLLIDENSIILIDVRNKTELEKTGKIPGSFNVPLPDIPEAFEQSPQQFKEKYNFDLPPTTAKNIVITCRSGRRVLLAQERLEPLGYTKLRLYRGSFNDWKANGGRIENVSSTQSEN